MSMHSLSNVSNKSSLSLSGGKVAPDDSLVRALEEGTSSKQNNNNTDLSVPSSSSKKPTIHPTLKSITSHLLLPPPIPSSFQKEWLANVLYDENSRQISINAMNDNPPQFYSVEEEEILTSGINLLNLVSGFNKSQTFKTPFSAIKTAKVFNSSNNGEVGGFVLAECCASPVDLAAYCCDFLSKDFEEERRNASTARNMKQSINQILEVKNLHHQVDFTVRHIPSDIVSSRSFLISNVWKRLDKNTILVVHASLDNHPSIEESRVFRIASGIVSMRPLGNAMMSDPKNRHIRASMTRVYKFTQTEKGKTKIEYGFNFNLNGQIPTIITRQIGPRINIDQIPGMIEYFQHLRALEKCDVMDGLNIGEILLNDVSIAWKRSSWRSRWTMISEIELKREAINIFVDKNEALRSCEKLYPWIRDLLAGLLSNRVTDASSSSTELNYLTIEEARKIGAGFCKCLNDHLTVEAGVAVWLGLNPSMRKLSVRFPFFVGFLNVIGRRKLKEAPWGLKWRVGLGASLSTLDMATDIYTIASFYEQGKYGYAQASLVMIGTCLFFWMFAVLMIYKKRGVKVLLYEWIIVLSCMKPAVDAYRVTSGAEMHADDVLDPFFEMIFGKQIEMFFEAIPACILQSLAYLSGDRTSLKPLISIAVSILSIAYSSTMLSYDTDISPVRKAFNPSFYGYIPEGGNAQLIIFSSMFLASFCQIILQVICIVFLATINGLYVVMYLSADVGIFFLYKLIRQDLRYWLNLDGSLSWIATFIVRLITKLNTDFTMNIHLRHSYELGGMYWSLNLGIHHVAAFVAAFLYLNSEVATKSDERTVWSVLICVEMSFLFFFSVFLMNINPKYLMTFLTTATATETAVALFHSGTDDAMKMNILNRHPSFYVNIREELKDWVGDNWNRWNEEKEEWFTSKVISNIPNEFIPQDALKELEKNGRRKK